MFTFFDSGIKLAKRLVFISFGGCVFLGREFDLIRNIIVTLLL